MADNHDLLLEEWLGVLAMASICCSPPAGSPQGQE
jgi:hypothetical protein